MIQVIRQRFHAVVIWLNTSTCNHEFKLSDLALTGIPEPEKPISRDYVVWKEYLDNVTTNDGFTKRVMWPCHKCGKVFMAHCGLDITPKHGYIVSR